MRSISTPPLLNGSIASTQSQVIDLDTLQGVSVQTSYVDDAPAVKTFTSGVYEVQTLTLDTKANTTDGDFVVIETAAGTKYAVALDKTGAEAAEPEGAIWSAVSAANKVYVDISGATSEADVAAIVATALDALSGLSDAITVLDNEDGTITLTQVEYGPTTNPVPKNVDESGAGSIAGVQTTAGVVDDNEITIASHPYVTGTKVALTTSAADLPAGLSVTNYYVIKVDENTIQLATSLANAVAGTAVNITDIGTGTHTLTAAASSGNVFKLQKSNDGSNWIDVSSMTVTIATTTGTSEFSIDRPAYRYLKVLYTPSAGQVTLSTYISQFS
jgi:hypothetical protein